MPPSYSQGEPSRAPPPRHAHARHPSSGAPEEATAGVGSSDDRQGHHLPRPRKTSITGASGTWNLGKTIGAGSMGKVKLARKADGLEQVT